MFKVHHVAGSEMDPLSSKHIMSFFFIPLQIIPWLNFPIKPHPILGEGFQFIFVGTEVMPHAHP